MKNKTIRFIPLLLAILLLFAACASNNTPVSNSTIPSASQPYAPLTFNNYSREITITQKPTKVLTLGPNCSELLVALGLGDLIIGNTMDNHSRGPLNEYADAYNKIPELTYGSATREAVLTSGADFIYGIDWEFGGEGLDLTELEQMGIAVYMNSATTLEEIYGEIEDLGKIFEIEESAQTFITEQKNRIQPVADSTKNEPTVDVLVYDSGNDGVFTCSGANFESLLIEKAGGKNIFDDLNEKQWVTVSYEEVLKRNPDVIVIHDYDAPSIEEKIAEIKANPSLAQLDAVKNERFVIIALESVLPGSRMAYAVETFYEGFYQ